jgi:hypothetical protein
MRVTEKEGGGLATAPKKTAPSEGNRQNGADDYEDNEPAGEQQRRRCRA